MAALDPQDTTTSSDLVTCRICQNELNQPKLLPCQHSFCKECLNKLNSTSDLISMWDFTLTCPCCERDVAIKNGGIEKLPDNYLFHIIQEHRAAEEATVEYCLPCQFGNKQTKATNKCLDCEDTFCNDCKKFHTFSSQTRHHKVVNIKEIEEGKHSDYLNLKQIKKCEKHSTPDKEVSLELFCHNCNCLVCTLGASTGHERHSCVPVDIVEEKARKQLKDAVVRFDEIETRESKLSGHIDKIAATVRKERDSVEDQIYQAADEIYALVDKAKEEKLEETKKHYEEELERLQKMKQEKLGVKNNTAVTRSFADAFLQHSSKSDFLNHFKDVESRVDDFFVNKGKDLWVTTKQLKIRNKPCAAALDVVKEILGEFRVRMTRSDISGLGEPKILFDVEPKTGSVSGLAMTEGNDIIAVGGSKVGVFGNDGKYKRWVYCEGLKDAGSVTVRDKKIYITNNLMKDRKVIIVHMARKKQEEVRMPEKEQVFHQQFGYHMGLAVDDNGNLFVSSSYTHTVYKWSPQSTIPQSFLGHTKLQDPTSLCITPKQELVVSNFGSKCVQAYDENGKLVWQYDGTVQVGDSAVGTGEMVLDMDEDMELAYPTGVCCDKLGYVYVCDDVNRRILVLNKGTFAGVIKPDGLHTLYGLAVNNDRQLIIAMNKKHTTGSTTDERKLIKLECWQ